MGFYKEIGFAGNDVLAKKIEDFGKSNSDCSIYAIYTDKVICETLSRITDIEHLLEVRIFNEKIELKATRGTMNNDFSFRIIEDGKSDGEYFTDSSLQTQYLDIDSTKTGGYTTIGGGKYALPKDNLSKMEIVNYYEYDADGIAHFADFRIVSFV